MIPPAPRQLAMPALEHVLRHNTWATGALLEFIGSLPRERLDARAGGTYGTLLETVAHVVRSEQWYVQLLTGDVVGRKLRRDDAHDPGELARLAETLGARALAVAEKDDPNRAIAMHEGRERSTVGVVLAQLVHHGNEHRTQATTILGANGIAPPPLSSWAYGRAVGLSTAEE
jgi:uncharacterized damage-inducible protein DinB